LAHHRAANAQEISDCGGRVGRGVLCFAKGSIDVVVNAPS